MPKLVLDGFEVSADAVGETGGSVTQVVQPNGRQTGLGDEVSEPAGQIVGMQWFAVGGGEDVAGLLPRRYGLLLFGSLPSPVIAQAAHRVSIECDGAATGCRLRWADGYGVAVGDALLADHDDAGVKVNVGPAQSSCLATTQTAQRNQLPHRR